MFGAYFAILALQLARGQEAATSPSSADKEFQKMVEAADDKADKSVLDTVVDKVKEKVNEVHDKVKGVVDEHLNDNDEGDKTSSGSKDEAGANKEEQCSAEEKSMEIWSTVTNGFKDVFTLEAFKKAYNCARQCGSKAKVCFYNVPSLIWQTICFVLFLCLFLCCGGGSCLGRLLCCLLCCRRKKSQAKE